ncbi:hypothetical protein EIB18_05755 [Caulobacter vibrioides]|nr:hypothetical protein CA608_05495 [Caulobacter vibrioides]AZH12260.1 hypothetical protein EIB18_05755 [Caulobacter vibrioides]PLR10540.1 hypothetical protein CVUC_13665 [Caulobacter vibrioides]
MRLSDTHAGWQGASPRVVTSRRQNAPVRTSGLESSSPHPHRQASDRRAYGGNRKMALLDHHRAPTRQHPAGSALCLALAIAGLAASAVALSWMMNFV